jgi:U32 family peptidase
VNTRPGNPEPRRLPELLAPAGSPEAFRAAVAAGADAIYLSGKRFGARKFAANFSDSEIEEAVRYAHTWGVKVYVTVNTLIHDRELAAVSEYLVWLYSIGVDAVLVQDTGLAATARDLVPGLVLHASTQMTIHNAAGVRWAAEQGFRRVVLARELSLDEIRAIAEETKDTGIGLETFAHGALCYSYSGQCLLSSVIGGRSGNRGMCAQPCRKPFAVVTGTADAYGRPDRVQDLATKDRYPLSPKDLCTYPRLPELLAVPIASLKIEGRMKSPDYVAIVVSTYRQALDAIAAGTFKPSDEALRDLLMAFNRGFTAGYLLGDRHGKLMGRDAPDNRGVLIGNVTGYDRTQSLASVRMGVRLVPVPGDGLLFRSPDRTEETGFALNTRPLEKKGELQIKVPGPVRVGSEVFLTASLELGNRARQIVAKPPAGLRRPLPVDLDVTVREDGSITFQGTVIRRNDPPVPVSYTPDLILEEARSRPLTTEVLEQQMGKTGGTPFILRNLTVAYSGDRFAPVAEINRIRREFLAAAEEQLVASCRPDTREVRHAQRRWQELQSRHLPGKTLQAGGLLRLGMYVDTPEGVQAAVAAGVDTVYFEPDLWEPRLHCSSPDRFISPKDLLVPALAICRKAGVDLVWKFPRITRDPYLAAILPYVPAMAEAGIPACMVENTGTALAVRNAAQGLRLAGSIGLNIFNQAAVAALSPLFSALTLSPELSKDEIIALLSLLADKGQDTRVDLIVQGTSEAMITEDCLQRLVKPCSPGKSSAAFTGLRDETGHIFPARVDHDCRTRIGNASEICLIDHLPSIRAAGTGEVVIDGRGRPPVYAGSMAALYRKAVTWTNTHAEAGDGHAYLLSLKHDAKQIALGGITTGHFLRGLKE